jgi:hypothetical protein
VTLAFHAAQTDVGAKPIDPPILSAAWMRATKANDVSQPELNHRIVRCHRRDARRELVFWMRIWPLTLSEGRLLVSATEGHRGGGSEEHQPQAGYADHD